MSTFLTHLNWRRAIKSFDRSKSLADADLKKILEAVRMAPTSFGLQPFRVEVVKDDAIRAQLQPASWNQDQIVSSGALLVFIADTRVGKRIDDMMEHMANGNATAREGLKPFEGMMRGFLGGKSDDEIKSWTAKQAYIALGFALAAATELKVDTCTLEGISGPDYDRILGLEQGLYSCVVLAVGHRGPAALMPQFRFPEGKLFGHR